MIFVAEVGGGARSISRSYSSHWSVFSSTFLRLSQFASSGFFVHQLAEVPEAFPQASIYHPRALSMVSGLRKDQDVLAAMIFASKGS
jgi:hypothetical protein